MWLRLDTVRNDCKWRARFAADRWPGMAAKIAHCYFGQNPEIRQRLVASNTSLVVEGFPRSANSFFWRAFVIAQAIQQGFYPTANPPRPIQLAQQMNLKIATHLHLAFQFHQAARYRIPAVLLIREPVGAIVSWYLFDHPEYQLPISRQLENYARCYVNYHRKIRSYRDHFVLACFHDAIHRFPDVVRRVNARFGTHFAAEINIADHLDYISATGNHILPDSRRNDFRAHTRSILLSDHTQWVTECRQVYHELTGDDCPQEE